MNGISKPNSETLYLHRDENDEIFVESVRHQHHIDGIRFLYKQFKKKKQGVIINNPHGYENSLQVALFLGAIRHLISDKPMLIVCEQGEELNWLDHFQKLFQCYNVGVGATSPFVNKSIFINTMERLEPFCRRDWSAMVVDNEAFLKERTLLPKFKADFKIWITPTDMKNNLQTFSTIYKWIFPKNNLNLEDFKPKPGSLVDAVSKAILLEAFLEDIVCRSVLQTPFENPVDKCEGTPKKVSPSKKNKDATGTKIKRSKRTSDVNLTSTSSGNTSLEAGTSAAKVPKMEDLADDFNTNNFRRNEAELDKQNNYDIESFIRNEKPIDEFDNTPRNGQKRNSEFMDVDSDSDTTDSLKGAAESNAPRVVVANEMSMDSDTNFDSLLPAPAIFDDTSHVSFDSDHGERKRKTLDFVTDNFWNEIKEEMAESHNSDNSKTEIEDDCDKDEESVKVIDKFENEKGMHWQKNSDQAESSKMQELDKVDDKHDIVKEKPDVVKEDSNEVIEDLNEAKKPDVIKECDKVEASPTKHDLDAKLREMDERAFKKFQGSILDRLF